MLNRPWRRAASIASCVFVMSECESPAGPVGVRERVPVGQVITASVDSADTLRRYSFTTIEGEHAVFLQVLAGTAVLSVMDSGTQAVVGGVFGTPASGTLADLSTGSFVAQTGAVYDVSVRAYPSRSTARFEFLVFRVNPDPEMIPATFSIGDTVTGETIDPTVDYDDFVMTGQAGQEVVAVAEALGPRSSGPVGLVVLDSVTNALLGAVFAPAGSPARTTTGRFRLPTSQDYRFRFRSVIGPYPRYRGAYRFWSYLINRSPEHRPPSVSVGSEVRGEAIDRAGDVDDFAFQGAAGDELNAFLQASRPFTLEVASATGATLGAVVSTGADTGLFKHASGRFRLPQAKEINVFFQSQNGSPETYLQLDALDPTGTVLQSVQSVGTDTSLFQRATGRFALLTTGTHRLRVTGVLSTIARDTGPYRLFLYQVNRRPETTPDTLAFGDSISGEAIALPGDVDEWRVTVPDSSGANLVLQPGADARNGSLSATLINRATGQTVAQAYAYTPTALGQSGAFHVAPGVYTLRVEGSVQEPALFQGSYRVFLYKFRFGPENVPDTLAIGDTVSGESLTPLGDVDVFFFRAARGQHLNLALQSLASGALSAFLEGPAGPMAQLLGGPGGTLGSYATDRLDIPMTGVYRLTINAGSGPYRFALEPRGVAPEVAGASLLPGDLVTSESIDFPGDWDEFTITAAPGQMMAVLARNLSGGFNPIVAAFDSTTGDRLGAVVTQDFDKLSERFLAPAGHPLKVAVFEPKDGLRFCSDATCNGVFSFQGGYRFTVVPVNPAPETAPAAFALGDTVRGEAIWPIADIDQFTSSASPGATLAVWWRLVADPVPQDGLITLEVIDPATGVVLAGSGVSLYHSSTTYFLQGSFVVPAGGTYLVRVRAPGFAGITDLTTAPYEFFVKP